MRERRRERRTTLRKPVLASAEATPVFILDTSRGGMRVAHRSQLPPPGAICRISLPVDGHAVGLDCAIVRTVIDHANAAAEVLFQSGLKIVSEDPQAAEAIRKACGLPEEDSNA